MSKPCSKRNELFSQWSAALNALSELENMKTRAIRDGNPDSTQWDSRLQKAREEESLAQREHDRHLAIHGCND